MNKEDKIIIAFIFNRSGKKEISFSDFFLTLSMGLNWFRPDEAKTFINTCLKNNLLEEEDKLIKPNFNIDEIKIPTGFYPSERILKKKEVKEENEDILDIIVNKIIEKSNLDKKTILNQIKEIEKEKNITTEISALLVGKDYDINFEEITEKIERKILKN